MISFLSFGYKILSLAAFIGVIAIYFDWIPDVSPKVMMMIALIAAQIAAWAAAKMLEIDKS